MRVTEVTLYHIGMEHRSPFRTSRWIENGERVLIEARADGLIGWGECVAGPVPGYCSETTKTNWYILEDFLIPATLAADIDSIPDYRDAIDHVSGHLIAKAGLEMALWDLLGKRDGISLQTMLGGKGSRVKVGVSIGIQETSEKLLQVVDGYLADGYQRVKLKIEPGRDESEVSIVREHYPDLALQVDGNSAYQLKDVAQLKRLDEYKLLMVEQPLAQDDIIDHAKLQPILATPICLDESIRSVDHARWALELGACRVINVKPGRVGGMHEAKRIHDYCHEHGVPVRIGGMFETGIGRAANVAMASLPGFTLPGDISASECYFLADLVEQPFELNPDSTLSVPSGPGLGIQVDLRQVEKVTLHRKRFTGASTSSHFNFSERNMNIQTIPNVLQLVLPERKTLPLLLDSPHSGNNYPEDFGHALPRARLRELEDAYVNELFGMAPSYGAVWLEALFPRSYIDPNRNTADVDPELTDVPFPGAKPGQNCKLGRGLLWRTLTTGEAIYDRRLTTEEISARIDSFHRPYQLLLLQQLRRLHGEFGQVWHVNCHSMPSVSGAMSLDGRSGVERPDIVLGDHHGVSCDPDFTQFVRRALEGFGYEVAVNKPYKGEELTSAYSKPMLGFNSLQIEVNRKLYMNEKTQEKNEGFDELRSNLDALVKRLAEFVAARLGLSACVA